MINGRKLLKLLGIGLILLVLILLVHNCEIAMTAATGPGRSTKTVQETRTTRIERKFSAWDGSHRNLTRYIKTAMKDPRSYEHIRTTYRDTGSYLIVKTVFRGRNSFGAMVINSITAKIDLNGNVIEIVR